MRRRSPATCLLLCRWWLLWVVAVVSADSTTAQYETAAGPSSSLADNALNDNNERPVQDNNEDAYPGVYHAQRQIEWVRSKGGFVNSKFGVRPLTTTSSSAVSYEVYAIQDLQKDELILSIPRECLISTEPDEPVGTALECGTAYRLYHEMQQLQQTNTSQFEPYITYLQETQEYGQLPSMYSEAAKALLWDIVGGAGVEADQLLPPADPTGWISHEWLHDCRGDPHDAAQHHAALLVVQRAWDDLLIPIYDMMSHRNGRHLNTESNDVHQPHEMVQVRASQFIAAGDPIYTSYDQCLNCGGRAKTYGTPEILRDYGFVERFPQKWIFHDQEVGFVLDDEGDDGTLQLTWVLDPPTGADEMDFFEYEMERLQELGRQKLQARPETVKEREWDVIVGYHQAVLTAMTRLVEEVTKTVEAQACAAGEVSGTCGAASLYAQHYNPLNELVPEALFNIEACDRTLSLDFSDYDDLETIQSPYQKIVFEKHPEHQDVCFDLDAILQMCGDYRPHYHEMVVHYTARFLPRIERVLWVGGGDSMLLHEILKYPSLELVIGLELDQQVTRYSFKHFGTQPHWDNEKVQWWYGDAAKSMLMLPKELYGTFDMVLVDLSETVMSMTVTKSLDILAALSLLLKPDGIFVKNEMYLEKMSDLFRHTVQVHFYDVPRLCSQCLCLGSNKVDFLQAELTQHNVDPLLKTLNGEIDNEDHYEIVNDYVQNPSSQRHCKSEEADEDPVEQENSPGIVMILEAEEAQLDLASVDVVKTALVKAAEKDGLGVVSAIPTSAGQGGGPRVVLVLREGYVVARTLPEKRYCALDIHLWSRFDKLESLKSSLLAAVGSSSKSSSSFRVVAGGMLGVPTWKDDEKSRGPKFTQECDETSEPTREAVMNEALVDTIIHETMTMLPRDEVVAAVLCGPEQAPCQSLSRMANEDVVVKIVPVRACSSIVGDIDFLEDKAERIVSCETEIISQLHESVGIDDDGKIGLVVLDPSAPFALAQIIDKIAGKAVRRKRLFVEQGLMAIAPVLNLEDNWRKVFLDRFRFNFFTNPTFRSEVLFNSTASSMEMGTFLAGDPYFVLHLDEVHEKVKTRTGLLADVRDIHQGAPDFQDPFEPSQFFLPHHYDQQSPLAQWISQQPWGLQTVFQMTVGEDVSKQTVKEMLGDAFAGMKVVTDVAEFADLGQGSVLVASWPGGDAVLLFDGRNFLTLNLFTFEEDVAFASELGRKFTMQNPLLKIALRDAMPRGHGRVVNFLRDVQPREHPHWAMHLSPIQK